MSKPQVFTRDDIVACADEVIGMSGGYNGAFNDGVLSLAGYLLDMQPEEVFDLMNGDSTDGQTILYKEGNVIEVMTIDEVIDRELETTGYDIEVIHALGGRKCQISGIGHDWYEVVPPAGWHHRDCWVAARFVKNPNQKKTPV